jgi:RNA processing factor Prp31
MIDTDRYTEDVEEKYNLIMELMDDEEREFEIKTRIRLSNKMKAAIDKLDTEVKRLHNHIRRMRHWAEPKMHEVHHDAWRKLHEEIYEGDEEE